jgi:hypothetical protein
MSITKIELIFLKKIFFRRIQMSFFLENCNFAIFGDYVDNFGSRYEKRKVHF